MSDYTVVTPDTAIQAVRALIITALDLPSEKVLVETRGRPRPYDNGPYVTVYWRMQQLLKQNTLEFVPPPEDDEQDGEERPTNSAYCCIRITVRGDDAYNLCSKLRYEFERGERWFDIFRVLGYSDIPDVYDLSAEYGGKIQQRAVMDFYFYIDFNARFPAPWFNKVNLVVNGETVPVPKKEFGPCPLPL